MPLRGILLMVFFVGSIPVCFVRPFYGILLWSIVAFLNPQAYTWSAAAEFPWAMAVAIPTLLGLLLFARNWRGLISREVGLEVALWVWFTITSIVSTHTPLFQHHAADTWYRWGFVSKILLMAVVTVPIVNTFERLRMLLLVIAGCFGAFVLKTLPFVIATGGVFRLYGPPNSMIADNNDFGLALNMTLPLFFFLAQTESRPWVKRVFMVLFLATIPAIFFTYSRGALVGLVVLAVMMFLQLRQRLLLVPVFVLALGVVAIFAPQSWKDRMDPTRADAVDVSARSRINAWTFSWRLANDYPIAGGGFATFTPELFEVYAPRTRDLHGPHSIYFQILAEHGFVGLFLFLMLVLSCFASMRRVIKLGRRSRDRELVNYAHMLWFSIVGFLVSGLFLGRAYFDYFYAIVACVVVLKRVALTERMEDSETEESDLDSEADREPDDVVLPAAGRALWAR